MTHFRTHLYDSCEAILTLANVCDGRIDVERFEPIQQSESLPRAIIGAGTSRVEREGSTSRFKGEVPFSIQIMADGEDGRKGAESREIEAEKVKQALLGPGSVWPRWTGRASAPSAKPSFEVVSVTETPSRGRTEGHRLISTTLIELGLKIFENFTDLPEDATPFEGIDFDVQTQGPDEAPAEMQFTVEP